MKKYTLLLISIIVFIACSKDDDKPKCDTCTIQGHKLELCDNGNGTYDYKSDGVKTATVTQALLDEAGVTSSEYMALICSAPAAGL